MNTDKHTPAHIERMTIAAYSREGLITTQTEHFLIGPRSICSSTSTNFREMGFGPDSELVKIITPTDEQGRVLPWKVRIGRKIPDTDLTIDAPVISVRHAIIYGDAESTYIVDMGSTNGTYVNGFKIEAQTPRQLLLSATLRFGPDKFPLEDGPVLQNFPWAYHNADALASQLAKYSGRKTA